MDELPPGYEVPVFQSLHEPILVAGVRREFALFLWLGVGLAVANGGIMRTWWVIPFGVVCHLGAAYGTRSDPDFLQVVIRRMRAPRRLHP
jgi:type IV secretory pathway TrbD component